MSRERDFKRILLNNIKKGKYSFQEIQATFKYSLSQEQRDYLLAKLPTKYFNLVYNNPFPTKINDLCGCNYVFTNNTNIIKELMWYFDCLKKFSSEINEFIELKNDFENSLLIDDVDTCKEKLKRIINNFGHSYYSIQSEFFINEKLGDSDKNIEIIKGVLNQDYSKLAIILDFSRLRISNKISSWQYESSINEHKKSYDANSNLLDYVDYKIDPLNLNKKFSHHTFIAYYDSDFSLIDRYYSLKLMLPKILFELNIPQTEKENILNRISDIKINDDYWNKIMFLGSEQKNGYKLTQNSAIYNQIQDYYYNSNYKEVIGLCSMILKSNPSFTDIYIFFVKSLIVENENLNNYFSENTEIFSILKLIDKVLRKEKTYMSDRDKLMKKYFTISHFGFSASILEFLYNEFLVNVELPVRISAYLNNHSYRYNIYHVLDNNNKLEELLNSIGNSKCFEEIRNLLVKDLYNEKFTKSSKLLFFQTKIIVSCLLKKSKYDEALKILLESQLKYTQSGKEIEFMNTWFNRTISNCYLTIGKYEKACDLIVNSFFEKGIAYDHYLNDDLILKLNQLEEVSFYRYLSIPILFEIYNQPQDRIYDSIANFLIQYNVYLPSEMIELSEKFPKQNFIYFLEKVCISENIQDSPFLNSIDDLEHERIKLLNHLKEINSEKIEHYNEEILFITRESSIRKGLMQIHESRIYIDTTGVSRVLESKIPEIFDRYIEMNDILFSGVSSLKLNQKINPKEISAVTYYFKDGYDPEQNNNEDEDKSQLDDKVKIVPYIRFIYFKIIFDKIKNEFIYNDDYGFKSFLSMRIRHGTFLNVLRSIFDKYKLISYKNPNLDSYLEIGYWNDFDSLTHDNKLHIQDILKEFSRKVDNEIDRGLSLINIVGSEKGFESAIFNFEFDENELLIMFHNRVGKIDEYTKFLEEIFQILYERLDNCLALLRVEISQKLSLCFVELLENLQSEIEKLNLNIKNQNLINPKIVSCKTEIQVSCEQISNWFKISKNQYIEEFPVDLILDTSLNYIDTINSNIIEKATVKISNNCKEKFKGKYFESFGDMFINIFDNIISKNKDLGRDLIIDISVESKNDYLEIRVTNNLSETIDINELNKKVAEIKLKIDNYKKGNLISSFEEGSGYLKICKCISSDLERNDYSILVKNTPDSFTVEIGFNLKNLIT